MTIGLDFDDVIAPFNSLACQMANEEYGTSFTEDDICDWENRGAASIIKNYYYDKRLYALQLNSVPRKNIEIVRRLMKIADVTIITGCYPQFAETRRAQIRALFPGFPDEKVVITTAKHLWKFDVFLDDNASNVLSNPSEVRVMMEKPWNKAVDYAKKIKNMEEFEPIIEQFRKSKGL